MNGIPDAEEGCLFNTEKRTRKAPAELCLASFLQKFQSVMEIFWLFYSLSTGWFVQTV